MLAMRPTSGEGVVSSELMKIVRRRHRRRASGGPSGGKIGANPRTCEQEHEVEAADSEEDEQVGYGQGRTSGGARDLGWAGHQVHGPSEAT